MHLHVSQWIEITVALIPSCEEWLFLFRLSIKLTDFSLSFFPRILPDFSLLCFLDLESIRLRLYFDPASTF